MTRREEGEGGSTVQVKRKAHERGSDRLQRSEQARGRRQLEKREMAIERGESGYLAGNSFPREDKREKPTWVGARDVLPGEKKLRVEIARRGNEIIGKGKLFARAGTVRHRLLGRERLATWLRKAKGRKKRSQHRKDDVGNAYGNLDGRTTRGGKRPPLDQYRKSYHPWGDLCSIIIGKKRGPTEKEEKSQEAGLETCTTIFIILSERGSVLVLKEKDRT